MPIECRIKFPRLTTDEMRSLDYQVMPHAFAAQNELGRLCDESVYQMSLAHRLSAAGFGVRIEEPIVLTFRGFTSTLCLDLVVNDRVPYELKAVSHLTDEHENQLLDYLLLTNACRGKLINFRTEQVESRFVNAPLDAADRRRFEIDSTGWFGDSGFQRLVTELVSDWGTSLDQNRYSQAIVACCGGPERVLRQIPMELHGRSLGKQRFLLATDSIPFRVTTFQNGAPPDYPTTSTSFADCCCQVPLINFIGSTLAGTVWSSGRYDRKMDDRKMNDTSCVFQVPCLFDFPVVHFPVDVRIE